MQKVIELRASNAHRWMICHGQPQAIANIESIPGSAADKGTVAHALLEIMLRLDIPTDEIDRFDGKPVLRFIEGRPADHIVVDEDMMDAVSYALDYVRSYLATHPKADFHAECLLDATSLIGYESGGTCDVIIVDLPREIVVVDYKNGVQHIDHVDNEQLQIYGLGAIDKFNDQITTKTKIKLVIIQPNSREQTGPVREIIYSYQELMVFAQRAAAAAKEAYSKNPKRVAGEHCSYCAAAGNCRTYADRALHAAALDFALVNEDMDLQNPEDMSAENIQRILTASQLLREWLDNIQAEAIRRLLAHTDIPGYKLVNSSPHRRWDDKEHIVNIVQTYAPDRIDELIPRMPLSPAQMERRLKHKRDGDNRLLRRLQANVTHNPVEPRLALVDDSRASYSASDDFKEK